MRCPKVASKMNRQRKCSKCEVELVNSNGVHMGIPFARYHVIEEPNTLVKSWLYCTKCYDAVTVDDHKVQQRIGDEVV